MTSSFSFSEPPLSISPPSALPAPPVDPAAQILVDELRTAILYAELIGNDGNLAKLCSTINSAVLFNETGINGTAVQNEVCSAAAIAKYLPGIAQAVILENQTGVSFLQAALFAVQVVSRMLKSIPFEKRTLLIRPNPGFDGCSDRKTLCNEVDEVLINNLFIGYVNGTGSAMKRYVCRSS